MAMSEYSLADIRAATEGNNGYCGDGWGMGCGGGGWIVWILLFALLGGNGWGWGNRQSNCATTEDLASGFNFNALQNKGNEILAEIRQEGRTTDNAICQIGYQNLQNTNLLERQIADCCCTTQRAIDGVKFDMANYAAANNANTTAMGQKILDKLCCMEMAQKDAVIAQQNQRIGQLELNQALCGVVRYPTSTTYASFCNPFFGGFNNCGCSNI